MSGQCRVATFTLRGVEAVPVEVEVDVGAGLPSFAIVGLPDAAIQEARERVRSGLRACGYDLPNSRVVVNLAPGPLRKQGTGFDLPIAMALLVATRQLARSMVDGIAVVGELSLDGTVRRVPGVMAHALAAQAAGMPLLTAGGEAGISALDGLVYLPLACLADLRSGLPKPGTGAELPHPVGSSEDFREVAGQELAVRALVIAAAGGHNVLMVGPPGSGKTMLARRLPSILPPLARAERLQTALVHSVAGYDPTAALSGVRPFRSPHHSASIAGIVGGGSPSRPGEASLAHNGVLFLDEMPEFGPAALQCLRQPMEDKKIVLVRADGHVTFPADFSLVGAANPCPCGYLGDSARECSCSATSIDRYRNRIGGPLLDRIDLVVQVDRPDPSTLLRDPTGEDSGTLRIVVSAATARAIERDGTPTARLSGARLLAACNLDTVAVGALEHASHRHHLSGRGVTKVLRVARTIADIDDEDRVHTQHIAEALAYRIAEPAAV